VTAACGVPSQPSAADSTLVGRYEQLRRDVLDREAPQPFGHAALLRHGMAAWIRDCERVAATVPRSNAELAPPPLPSGVRGEMVVLLAEMALDLGRQEAST
jgi:hypothetical protein